MGQKTASSAQDQHFETQKCSLDVAAIRSGAQFIPLQSSDLLVYFVYIAALMAKTKSSKVLVQPHPKLSKQKRVDEKVEWRAAKPWHKH